MNIELLYIATYNYFLCFTSCVIMLRNTNNPLIMLSYARWEICWASQEYVQRVLWATDHHIFAVCSTEGNSAKYENVWMLTATKNLFLSASEN